MIQNTYLLKIRALSLIYWKMTILFISFDVEFIKLQIKDKLSLF